jgi:hypothetical protein
LIWLSVTFLLWRMNLFGRAKVSPKYRHLDFVEANQLARREYRHVKAIDSSVTESVPTEYMRITVQGKYHLMKATLSLVPWLISILALIISILAYLKR